MCAVVNRRDLLFEVFLKSNRIALMWAAPFAACAALFAHDLAQFVLGDRWLSTAPLIAAMALCSGVGQVAFNWTVFMRAINNTRPLLIGALVDLGVFVAVMIPALIGFGLVGYAIGIAFATLAQLIVRAYFLRRLFPRFRVRAQFTRAVLPALPPTTVVLVLRAVGPGGRSLTLALAELVLFCLVAAGSTYLLERPLVTELASYFRRRTRGPALPAIAGRSG